MYFLAWLARIVWLSFAVIDIWQAPQAFDVSTAPYVHPTSRLNH